MDPQQPEHPPTAEELELAAAFTAGEEDDFLAEPPPGTVEPEVVREARQRRRTVLLARKIGVALGGGLILAAGIAMIPLPGPGWLVVVLGLWVLSFEFQWAERMLDRIRDKVVDAAHLAAANRWGTALSVLSACAVIAAGIAWATWEDLPYSSWTTGGPLSVSGVLALLTIGWSLNDLKKKRARQATATSEG